MGGSYPDLGTTLRDLVNMPRNMGNTLGYLTATLARN